MKNTKIKELKYNLILAGISCFLIGTNFVLRENFPCLNCWYYSATTMAIYLYLGLAILLSLRRANKLQKLTNLSLLQCFAFPLRTFMLITLLNIATHLGFSSWVYPNLRAKMQTDYTQIVAEKAKSESEKREKTAQFPLLFVVYFAQQILFCNTLIAIPSSLFSILIFRRKFRYA